MTDAETNLLQTWYEIYDASHTSSRRREWYSSVASAYQWARPRYPESMLDRILHQANLTHPSSVPASILEIGCGPGIVTATLARRGFSITAIEPSQTACQLARESCRDDEQVTVIHDTFEDYDLGEGASRQAYDAVLAATSFHWIDPAIACRKAAAALKPGGALILLWATPPQADQEVYESLAPIYEAHGLTTLGQEQCRSQAYYQHNFEAIADMVNNSGFFHASQVEIEQHQSRYSVNKYLALLSSLSGYIELEAQRRDQLLTNLGTALARTFEVEDHLNTTHWFAAQVAFRKSM